MVVFHDTEGQHVLSFNCSGPTTYAALNHSRTLVAYVLSSQNSFAVALSDSALETLAGNDERIVWTLKATCKGRIIGLEWVATSILLVVTTSGFELHQVTQGQRAPRVIGSQSAKQAAYMMHGPSNLVISLSSTGLTGSPDCRVFDVSTTAVSRTRCVSGPRKGRKMPSVKLHTYRPERAVLLDEEQPILAVLNPPQHIKLYNLKKLEDEPTAILISLPDPTHLFAFENTIAVISSHTDSVVIYDHHTSNVDAASRQTTLPPHTPAPAPPAGSLPCPGDGEPGEEWVRVPGSSRAVLRRDTSTVIGVTLDLPAILKHHNYRPLDEAVAFVLARGPHRRANVTDLLADAVRARAPLHSMIRVFNVMLDHGCLAPTPRPVDSPRSPLGRVLSPGSLSRVVAALTSPQVQVKVPPPASRVDGYGGDMAQSDVVRMVSQLDATGAQTRSYLASLLIVIVNVLVQHRVPLKTTLVMLLVDLHLKQGLHYQLHQLVQHGVVASTKSAAMKVQASEDGWPAASMVARDMLTRGGLYRDVAHIHTDRGAPAKAARVDRLYVHGKNPESTPGSAVSQQPVTGRYQHWVM